MAWKELDVPECGYCQAGQIMAAAALLATTPKPTDAQIDTAMNGNICRCGTYMRIREGIHRAASGNLNAAQQRRRWHEHPDSRSPLLPSRHRASPAAA